MAAGEPLHVLEGHGGAVYGVTYSPDGSVLASASVDGSVILWDAASGRRLRTLGGHHSWVLSLAFAPDGATLAAGTSEYTIVLWDVESGRRLRSLRTATKDVMHLAYRPDGRLLASGAGGRGIPLKVSAPFHCSLMSPAADRLASALDEIEIGELSAPVVSNVDAEPNADPSRVKELLVAQVTGRVRWEASVRTAHRMGVEQALEIGHGAVLKGLVRRIEKTLRVTPVGTPEQIGKFAAAAAEG